MTKTGAFFCFVSLLSAAVSEVAYGQAFAIPQSDRVLRVEVTLPGGEGARVEVRDGTMLTIENERTGYLYGFAMAVKDKTSQGSVMSLEITNPNGDQEVKQFWEPGEELGMDLVSENPLKVETPHGSFTFHLEGILKRNFPRARPLKDPSNYRPEYLQNVYGKSGGGTCCVSCGSFTVCASQVTLSCGNCDSGGIGGGRPAV